MLGRFRAPILHFVAIGASLGFWALSSAGLDFGVKLGETIAEALVLKWQA